MGKPHSILYGIPISEIARVCQVSLKTAGRWKVGTICPPATAVFTLAVAFNGDLGAIDSAWTGWTLRFGKLRSPEGWMMTRNELLATRLLEAQLAAYRQETLALREEIDDTWDEQPAPDDWLRLDQIVA